MSVIFIVLLILLTLIFFLFKWTKAGIVTLFVLLGFFMLIGSGIVPSFLMHYLQSYPYKSNYSNWGSRNAIVVLGGGADRIPNTSIVQPSVMSYSRIVEAEKLYYACKRAGRECTIIGSGGDAMLNKIAEAVIYQNELTQMNVVKQDIRSEAQSLNTHENAQFSARLLKRGGFDRIYLVTSGFHLKRSVLWFSYYGAHVIPVPSDYIKIKISPLPWGYNFAMTDFALHELLGIVQYYILTKM